MPFATVQDAARRFSEAALAKAADPSPPRAGDANHRAMSEAWLALEAQGEPGASAARELLTLGARPVRCWVAAQLLALGDATMAPLLEAEAAAGGALPFSVAMVLAQWKKGRLRPPFRASASPTDGA